ncbi:MAG TPA: nitrile hydratase accessory protein [Candidatus Dormibacteraeota bacterium]
MSVERAVADLEGLPRKNGELVFNAPWEGHAFGMAVALSERGAFAWDDFRERLGDEIGRADREYYASWLAAFERVLLERGLLSQAEVTARADEYRTLRRDPVF